MGLNELLREKRQEILKSGNRKVFGGTGFQPVQHRPEACTTSVMIRN